MRYGRLLGLMKRTRIYCLASTSIGCPFFSYTANKKNGKTSRIITRDAALTPMELRNKKYTGIPTSAASVKQINCLLVKLNITLVLTLDKSFGTST